MAARSNGNKPVEVRHFKSIESTLEFLIWWQLWPDPSLYATCQNMSAASKLERHAGLRWQKISGSENMVIFFLFFTEFETNYWVWPSLLIFLQVSVALYAGIQTWILNVPIVNRNICTLFTFWRGSALRFRSGGVKLLEIVVILQGYMTSSNQSTF